MSPVTLRRQAVRLGTGTRTEFQAISAVSVVKRVVNHLRAHGWPGEMAEQGTQSPNKSARVFRRARHLIDVRHRDIFAGSPAGAVAGTNVVEKAAVFVI